MANKVYANNMEVSCKAANGKSICAFPDVCFTPPQTPATPPGVPIPYPNTGLASDTTNGSSTVKISGQEVGIKDKSYFKKSTGDEAGSAPKKGLINSNTKGKVYFKSWSMDVKIEGENAVRHMDMVTHNHASANANEAAPWMYADMMAFNDSQGKVCKDEQKEADTKCEDAKPRTRVTRKGNTVPDGLDCSDDCKKAKACVLKPKKDDKNFCCHSDTTGHHLIEVHCFSHTGKRGKSLPGLDSYNQSKAPCVCASQSRADGSHGVLHAVQGQMEAAYNDGPSLQSWPGAGKKIKAGGSARHPATSKWTYKNARDAGVLAHKTAFPHCNAKCISDQLDDYHKGECHLTDETPLRSDPGSAKRSCGDLAPNQQGTINAAIKRAKGILSNSTNAF